MKHKILIVEDNEFISENFSEILELNNYTAFAAGDGKTGLAIAQQQYPYLILSAIKMPVMVADDHVIKPFLAAELLSTLKQCFLSHKAV